jgi:aminoglycoside phosphotransferase (APT) family kinase protein
MPDESPLHPQARAVMQAQGLPVKQVLQNGPRYAVVSTEYEGNYAIFKMVIPDAKNPILRLDPDPLDLVSLEDIMLKEIRLLEMLDSLRERIDGLTTHLYSYSTEPSCIWYLRELYRGRPLGDSKTPFRFDRRFYEEVTAEAVMAYITSLHRLSGEVTPELSNLLVVRWPYEVHTRELAAVLHEDFNHPYVRERSQAIGEFLMQVQREVAGQRDVITHHEPYGAHTFVQNGRIGLIDWEQMALGHRLFDLAIIWVRTFDHPVWQAELMRLMQERDYLNDESQRAWDMLVLVQCIANNNHFRAAPMSDQAYQAELEKFLVGTIKRIVGQL